jgi:HEPN domain
VDESLAWLKQALSDRAAGERLVRGGSMQWCHAVAKYQQTVEKAIKAIVVAVREAGIMTTRVGYGHSVENFVSSPFVSSLLRRPRNPGNRDIARHLSGLLDQNTRHSIHSLESLIPRQPLAGQLHRKNTEYPFEHTLNGWTFPAADGVFSLGEVRRFRDLSYHIADGASRIITAIQSAPR